ncbi:DUF6183 family protein [Streptomyces inhibens]|uniref:DUF6183 family protein n=1 Tax=Streptomyces inhibens TaxID=2293571 RepID=UPI002468024E|nr:DUF6183 family protein [Streptomyces inhibens]
MGTWEGRCYELPEPLDAADWNAALLTGLPADCLSGLTAGTLAAVHTTADDVPADLFLAAFSGGLWGQGLDGAYARRAARRGLYALMDLPWEVSHHEAVRRAAGHRWLRFTAERHTENRWFHGDLSDVGFAVLDPTRRRIALLAATDTD